MRNSFLFCFLSFAVCAFGQHYKLYKTQNYHNQLRLNTSTGEVVQIQDDGQMWLVTEPFESTEESDNRFRLYETQNMWTFIELDTYTGRTWQVQYSAKSPDEMFAIPIESEYLGIAKEPRFRLYGTQNMWTFIELDTYTGKIWQLQYSLKNDNTRFIIPINSDHLNYTFENVFDIQPMTSMYQYYLINTKTGEMWQFQWNTKPDKGDKTYRWIKKL